MKLAANTAFGLETSLKYELMQLGVKETTAMDGMVFFEGDLNLIYQANLYLRTAEHVFIVLKEKEVHTFDDYFDAVYDIPFEEYLNPKGAFHIHAKSKKSVLMSEKTLQSLGKKALLKRLENKLLEDTFKEEGPVYTIEMKLSENQLLVLLDTSGEALHKRGYRKEAGEAPMKETLAAAMVLMSRYHKNASLIDPFCGSGTILIEAAMIARNIPPGLTRKFIFETFKNFDSSLYQTVKKTAYQAINHEDIKPIQGFDIDKGILEKAKNNAERAGVDEDIIFEERRFEMSKISADFIITNPPYDERLASRKTIDSLYKNIGRTLKMRDRDKWYIISSVQGTEKLFSERATKTRVVFNGPLKARIYQYFK